MAKTAKVVQLVQKSVPGLVTGIGSEPINKWVREVWEKAGDLSDLTLFPTDVLVAHFERSHLGSGLLLAAPKTQKEDRYQGKVGLVIGVGTQAYVDAEDASFFGFKAQPGDWVVYKHNDGREFGLCVPGTMSQVIVRAMKDGEIFAKIPRPDRVW